MINNPPRRSSLAIRGLLVCALGISSWPLCSPTARADDDAYTQYSQAVAEQMNLAAEPNQQVIAQLQQRVNTLPEAFRFTNPTLQQWLLAGGTGQISARADSALHLVYALGKPPDAFLAGLRTAGLNPLADALARIPNRNAEELRQLQARLQAEFDRFKGSRADVTFDKFLAWLAGDTSTPPADTSLAPDQVKERIFHPNNGLPPGPERTPTTPTTPLGIPTAPGGGRTHQGADVQALYGDFYQCGALRCGVIYYREHPYATPFWALVVMDPNSLRNMVVSLEQARTGYKVTLDNKSVTVTVPDGNRIMVGNSQVGTVNGYLQQRWQKALDRGIVQTVGGRRYIVDYWGGNDSGGYAFLDEQALRSALAGNNPAALRQLAPIVATVVKNTQGTDIPQPAGYLQPVGGNNPKWWGVTKQEQNGRVFYRLAQVDAPPVPPPPTTPGGTGGTPGGTGGTPGGTGGPSGVSGWPATLTLGQAPNQIQLQANQQLFAKIPDNLRDRIMFYSGSDGSVYAIFGREPPVVPFKIPVENPTTVDIRPINGQPYLIVEGARQVALLNPAVNVTIREEGSGFKHDGLDAGYGVLNITATSPAVQGAFGDVRDRNIIEEFARRLGHDMAQVTSFLNQHRTGANAQVPVNGGHNFLLIHTSPNPIRLDRDPTTRAYTTRSGATDGFGFVDRRDANLTPTNVTLGAPGSLGPFQPANTTEGSNTYQYLLVGAPAAATARGGAIFRRRPTTDTTGQGTGVYLQVDVVATAHGSPAARRAFRLPLYNLSNIDVADVAQVQAHGVVITGAFPAVMQPAIPPAIAARPNLRQQGMIALYSGQPSSTTPGENFIDLVAWWGYADEAAARAAAGLPARSGARQWPPP